MAQALPPSFVICATVCSQSAIRLAVTTTFAPSDPNRSAIALPMPLLLPRHNRHFLLQPLHVFTL